MRKFAKKTIPWLMAIAMVMGMTTPAVVRAETDAENAPEVTETPAPTATPEVTATPEPTEEPKAKMGKQSVIFRWMN